MLPHTLKKPTLIILAIASVSLGVLLGTGFTVRYMAAMVLLIVLPGLGLVRWITGQRAQLTGFERVILGLAAGYPFAVVVTLLVHYVPGPPTAPLAVAAYALGTALLWLVPHKGSDAPAAALIPLRSVVVLALILAGAGFLSFAHLGTSEFQGDEAMVLMNAGGALQGDDTVLFYHRKAPAEILLPLTLWLLSGTITEFMARFPFALSGLLAVPLLYMLGRRMFNESVGLAAAALLALNGYLIGFSRIVQYQSLVIMLTVAALCCFWMFAKEDCPRFQILGAVFVAAGLLAHYDGFFALPPIAYLYWCWLRGRSGFSARQRRIFLAALAVGLGLLCLFYVPFLNPEYFGQTSEYLQFRVGGDTLYNNLSMWLHLSTTYNSTYYVAFLIVLAGVAAFRYVIRGRGIFWVWGGVALAAVFTVVWFPALWRVRDTWFAFVPFLLLLPLVFVVARRADGFRAAWVWFGVPFLVYNFFLVKYPGTHFWTMFPGLALVAGAGAERLEAWGFGLRVSRPWVSAVAAAAVIVISVIFGYYLYVAFVRVEPEFRSGYPTAKPAFYWAVYDELPSRDFFGFPHRAGWKAVSVLYEQDVLEGEFNSNEGGEITSWYLPHAPRYYCRPSPKYYFIAQSVQDREEVPEGELGTRYALTALVTVGGRPGIQIYERDAVPGPIDRYALEDYEWAFDRDRTPWNRLTTMGQFIQTTHSADFGGFVELLGYDLDVSRDCAGSELVLTLFWRRKGTAIPQDYKVFVHLESDRLWGQADDMPGCSAWPTTTWRPGEIVADRHIVPVDAAAPPGDYVLKVGLYEPLSGMRLDVLDEAGNPQSDHLELTQIELQDSCVRTAP